MRQYSADEVKIVWLGLELHAGAAAGTFFQPSRGAPTWTAKPDGYGGTVELASLDTSGELTIILDQESRQHAQLKAIGESDRISRSLAGTMIISDLSSGETLVYKKTRIKTIPDPTKSTGLATIAWVFQFESVHSSPFNPDKNRVGT